jgi:hypothetical protein
MRFHQAITLTGLALVGCLTATGWSQEWGKTRLVVVPGKSVGSINIGEHISANTRGFLGKPTLEEVAGKAYASGFSLWGKGDSRDLKRGLRLHFSDGKDPAKVVSIEVAGLRASTEDGIFLGQPASKILKVYPEAQLDLNPVTHNPEYVIPGLIMRLQGTRLNQFVVEPLDQEAWRFYDFKVVAGKSVGPFQLGHTVSGDVYAKLGQPTMKVAPGQSENSGLLRWSLPGRDPGRKLDVVLHDVTDKQVKIGDTASVVKSIYSEGKSGLNQAIGSETWRVPGLNLILVGGKLKEMQIYRPSRG